MRKNTSLTSHIGRLLLSLSTLAVAGAGIATAASGAMFTDTADSTMDVSSGWVDVATYQAGTRVGTTSSLTALSVSNANLVAGTSETLCLRISLPSSTPNAIAGKTSTVTLTVASQQL